MKGAPLKVNLHTHTARCGHAAGSDEEYVKAALEGGFDVLGFSDHVPWPYASGFWNPRVRMHITHLQDYLNSVRGLRARYAEQIRILCGFECEYFPEYMSWLPDMAEEYGLDYLILGCHYDGTDETGMYFGNTKTAAELARYVSLTVRGLETGLFSYLAHPDLFMKRWPGAFDADCRAAARDLCEACRAFSVPMEYNTHVRFEHGADSGYPCREMFLAAKEAGVPVLIGLDAHNPAELSDPAEWNRAEAELKELGLTRLQMPELISFAAPGEGHAVPFGGAARKAD